VRLVFVNNAHPLTPHVSGMRLYQFAIAMARRGHQVVLLTGASPDGRAAVADLHASLIEHDWSRPLVVSVPPRADKWLDSIRSGRIPALLRRAMTAWQFIAHGGVFSDWTQAAMPIASRLATEFQPDLVWATFGNTSNLTLGQFLAGHARCPWVADVKDNWTAFVPAGLRRLMAFRFRGADGLTSNAEHHLNVAGNWLRQTRTAVIYSGVSDAFYTVRQARQQGAREKFVLLVGSTYSTVALTQFISAFKRWRASAADRAHIRLHYAGSDASKVRAAIESAGLTGSAVVHEQLALSKLAYQSRQAAAVCYLWAPFGFHHKLLELLVAGSPVISYPGEHAESQRLASSCVTPFFACKDVDQLMAAFDQTLTGNAVVVANEAPPSWRWSDFCEDLDVFLTEVASTGKRACAG